jgi:exopolysaccharide biosynthesis polyprenyl glycosylphosphotransferase
MNLKMNKAVKRNWRTYFIALAIAIDIVGLLLATMVAIYVRIHLPYPLLVPVSFLWKLGFCFDAVMICNALVIGVYRSVFHINLAQQYFLLSKAYLFTIFIVFFAMVFPFVDFFPRKFTLLYLLMVPLFPFLSRYILFQFNKMMQKKGYGIFNVLIIGDEVTWRPMLERIRIFPELGYKIVGLIIWDRGDTQNNIQLLNTYENLPVYPLSFMESVIELGNVERIFLSKSRIWEQEKEILSACQKHKIKLKVVTREAEDMLRFSYVRDISGLPLFSPERRKIEAGKQIVKRVFDILFSALAILFLLPLLLLVTVLIYLEDQGPIIYKQKRALAKGRGEFLFYKFRSMVPGAEQAQQDLYKQNEVSGGLFFIENDPRVTRVGRLIRKYSIDELPQLFNVLKGDMSIVGPRPLSLADINNITMANSMHGYYALRAKAKPGLTGLWQISGRREINFREMVLLDLYYIENQSILFDIEIILETIPVVLFGKGAY